MTKSAMRRDTLSKIMAERESDVEFFVEHVTKQPIQQSLKTYIDGLKNRKTSKP